jgi:hypothetical protein
MDAFSTLASQYPIAAGLAVIACLLVGVGIAAQRHAQRRTMGDSAGAPGHLEYDLARQALETWMEALQALEAPLREGDRDAYRRLLARQPLQPPAALLSVVDNPAFPVRDAESVLRLLHLADDIGPMLQAERDLLDQRRALEAFLRSVTLLYQALTCTAALGSTLHAPPEVAVGV